MQLSFTQLTIDYYPYHKAGVYNNFLKRHKSCFQIIQQIYFILFYFCYNLILKAKRDQNMLLFPHSILPKNIIAIENIHAFYIEVYVDCQKV